MRVLNNPTTEVMTLKTKSVQRRWCGVWLKSKTLILSIYITMENI